jgi:hypothetical protein
MKVYKLMGSRRMENDSHDNIYFRLAHIGGSPTEHKSIGKGACEYQCENHK